MRESNFAFPAQNKACVCITSQLYYWRGMSFFLSSQFFYDFFISFGHDFAIAAIQFAYASDLFDIYL